MKLMRFAVVAGFLTLSFVPLQAQAPESTYAQTSDWVVKKLTGLAGYTRGNSAVTYKDVSMEGCQLRFTTLTVDTTFTDTDTFTLSLASIKTTHWGTLRNPLRAYVVFDTSSPVSFSHRRLWLSKNRKGESYIINTSIASLELGQPGVDYSDMAKQMKIAIVHAAEMCRTQASNITVP